MDTKYEMNTETFTDQELQAMFKSEDRFADKLTDTTQITPIIQSGDIMNSDEIQKQHQNAQYAWLLADLDT